MSGPVGFALPLEACQLLQRKEDDQNPLVVLCEETLAAVSSLSSENCLNVAHSLNIYYEYLMQPELHGDSFQLAYIHQIEYLTPGMLLDLCQRHHIRMWAFVKALGKNNHWGTILAMMKVYDLGQ